MCNMYNKIDTNNRIEINFKYLWYNLLTADQLLGLQRKETVSHPSVTVTDGMQICDGMQNRDTVSDGMQNIAPVVHTYLPLSTDSFVAICYSPKIGGIG